MNKEPLVHRRCAYLFISIHCKTAAKQRDKNNIQERMCELNLLQDNYKIIRMPKHGQSLCGKSEEEFDGCYMFALTIA